MIKPSQYFKGLKFTAGNHSYKMDDRPLKSVTQKLGELKTYADWNAIALKCSMNQDHEHFGKGVEEIRRLWKENGIKGMKNGTIVHNYIEHRLKGEPYQIYDTDWLPEMTAFEDWWNYHKKYLEVVALELQIGDSRLGVAGTVDGIFWDKRVDKYRISDWKTGKKFKTGNVFQQYKVPFHYVEECEINTYSMQTSLYRLILEVNVADMKFGDPFIVWLKNDGKWQEFRAIDYRDQLNKWLTGDEF